jgi:hypothetical protein
MTSPPTSPSRNLQRASRISGGIIRGRALGNTFNLADAADLEMDMDLTISVPGKVYIYESVSDPTNLDPINVKPRRILKADVTRTLGPVLMKLAWKYSPIRSKLAMVNINK